MRRLLQIWDLCKRVSQFLNNVNARVLLTLFYFSVLVPFALGVRWFADPLRMKEGSGSSSHWQAREPAEPVLDEFRRQF